MSIESDLYTLLTPIVATYPDVAPQSAARPYATYTQVGGQSHGYLGPEPSDLRNARMQVNVWCDTRLQASDIAQLIEVAIVTASQFRGSALGAFASTYDDAGLYGTRQDFSLTANR